MVVVMTSEATPEEVEAVVRTVEAAGGDAFVSRGVHRTIVGLVGDVERFETLNLAGLPGVSDVVRISSAYKLVSRENHPETSTVTVAVRDDGAIERIAARIRCAGRHAADVARKLGV